MKKITLIGSVFSSLVASSLFASAKAITILDSFPSTGSPTAQLLFTGGASRPLGVPLFTPSTGTGFKINSFEVSLSKNSVAAGQTNSNYNFQVDLYQYFSSDTISTNGPSTARNLLLPLSGGDLIASNTFTLASNTLSNTTPTIASQAARFFSAATPNQSVGSNLLSLFNVNFQPSQYYLLLFSNPTAASTGGANGAATGNATYYLRMTGSSNAITNTTPDANYLRWNDNASAPCSTAVPTTLANGQSCRYPMIQYTLASSTAAVNANQIWLQIDTPVPGPLPILGGLSAFHASRRMRKRLKTTTAVR